MRRNKNTRRNVSGITTGKRCKPAPHTEISLAEFENGCNYLAIAFLAMFGVMSAGAVFLGW